MAEFTLLKLQVDDASFTANAPFSGNENEESDGPPASASGSGSSAETGTGAGRANSRMLPLLVGFVFLLVAAVAVRKLRRGSAGSEATDAGDRAM
jgi:hypothetical protein